MNPAGSPPVEELEDLHGQGGAVVGLGRGDHGLAVGRRAEPVVEEAEREVGRRVMLDPVELVLDSQEIEPEPVLEIEQGVIDLHLEEDHVPGQMPGRIGPEFDPHPVLEEEPERLLGPGIRDGFGHLEEAQAVESLPGDAEHGQEIGVGDLVPHLHGARPDGAVDHSGESRGGCLGRGRVGGRDGDVDRTGEGWA